LITEFKNFNQEYTYHNISPIHHTKLITHHKTSSTYVLENKQYEIAFAN